jgi:anaerobic magnesium-protoporphyrin IX monomethyl ester cyclase
VRLAFVNASVGGTERRKSEPIGLSYIMSYLAANGISSDGFDFGDAHESPEQLVKTYAIADYDLVGISVYNESFSWTMELVNAIKNVDSAAFIVLGGPQATATHSEILESFANVDAVVRREGELPMLALVQALSDATSLAAVPSLTWRRKDSEVVTNPDGPTVDDLDTLPFPSARFESTVPYRPLYFYDAQTGAVEPAIAIVTSRSCPYNCSFCGVLTIGRKYRRRSPDNVVAELEFFRERDQCDYRHIYFTDANYFVQHQRALEIAQALNEYDPSVTFSFGTRVNQVLRAQGTIEAMLPLGDVPVDVPNG